MTAIEKNFELFSPAGGGGEKPLGFVAAALSETNLAEKTDGDVISAVQSAAAIVRNECAPDGGFARGMTLRGGGKRWRVCGATSHRRVWTLRLERVIMDGEV